MDKEGKEFKMLRGSQGSKDQRTQELGRGDVLEAGEVLMFQGVEGIGTCTLGSGRCVKLSCCYARRGCGKNCTGIFRPMTPTSSCPFRCTDAPRDILENFRIILFEYISSFGAFSPLAMNIDWSYPTVLQVNKICERNIKLNVLFLTTFQIWVETKSAMRVEGRWGTYWENQVFIP